jgi:glucose-6-phosphate isomerase
MSGQEIWQDVELAAAQVRRRGIPRVAAMTAAEGPLQWSAGDLMIDLSWTGLTRGSLDALLALAEARDLGPRLAARFGPQADPARAGIPAPLLRRAPGEPVALGGREASVAIAEVRRWPALLAEALRDGGLTAAGGRRFRHLVQVGGGSESSAAALVAGALADPRAALRASFLPAEDAGGLLRTLAGLDPAETFLVLALADLRRPQAAALAAAAARWLVAGAGPEALGRQMAAVAAAPEAFLGLGLAPAQIIVAPEPWAAGGSVWSPVNLGLMAAVGPAALAGLAAGARTVDAHVRNAPAGENLAVLLGLADLWTGGALGAVAGPARTGDPALAGWARYAAELTPAAAVPATSGLVARDTLVTAEPHHPDWADCHRLATADALAAARLESLGPDREALVTELRALGLTAEEAAARAGRAAAAGGHPGVLIACRRVDAATLGALIALAEHRAFVTAAVARSLGRRGGARQRAHARAAEPVLAALDGAPAIGLDPATRGILRHLMALAGATPTFLDSARSNVVRLPPLPSRARAAGARPAGAEGGTPLRSPSGP